MSACQRLSALLRRSFIHALLELDGSIRDPSKVVGYVTCVTSGILHGKVCSGIFNTRQWNASESVKAHGLLKM